MLSSDTNSGRNIAIKNNVSALKKLSNLSHKERKFHLNNWGVDAFKDIKKYLKLYQTEMMSHCYHQKHDACNDD